MKFCLSWLEEWLGMQLEPQSLAEDLTMAGLEVEKLNSVAKPLSDIVAGRIQHLEDHPDAERLKLCQLDVGGRDLLHIVCSAPNLYVGMRAPLALIGAKIGDRQIAATNILGVPSNGMLCSAAELGIEDASGGILDLGTDVAIGADVIEYLKLEDKAFELDLTPNRADCFSLLGLARELAAIRGYCLKVPYQQAIAATQEYSQAVTVEEPRACPRYFSRVIRGVDLNATTPLWMQERLRRSGVRALHPVVDIMSYVMLDLGQPLHAFDLDKIQGELVVRYARAGESIELIGGTQVEIDEGSLLIADACRPLALAGIAGGADSAVSPDTRKILIECAFFEPAAIRGKARSHGLHTEASLRFERGVDPGLQERAMERASELLELITGGEFGPVSSVSAAVQAKQPVELRYDSIVRRLGIEIEAAAISRMLVCLGCQTKPYEGGWHCTLPSHRFDLDIEEDLIEEVGRLYGYDKIGRSGSGATSSYLHTRVENDYERLDRYCDRLVERGYVEVITYSFTDPLLSSKISQKPVLALKNPISPTTSVLRTSLWPGLLKALTYNLNRQRERVRIFESGRCFDGRSEQSVFAGLAYGSVCPEQWSQASRVVDFYDLRADIENLLAGYSTRLSCEASRPPGLHAGQAATILIDGNDVGCLGSLAPAVAQQLGIGGDVFLFEIKLDMLPLPELTQASTVSRYPSVRRDISLLVPIDVDAGRILKCIDALGIEVLQKVVFFDVYVAEKEKTDWKSMTLGLIFQDVSSTLDERICVDSVERVVAALADTLKISLRK